jgi:hypothetical protein
LLPLPVDAAPGRAKLKLTPGIFDFGYIPQGFKVTARYWLANTGKDTLLISTVKPQCGCTTAPLKRDRISPADSVPLDVVFDSKNITGVINKKVTIVSNDATRDSAEIFFTGRVESKDSVITVEPRFATFIEIDKRKEIIKLSNNSPVDYRVQLAAPPPDFIKCELSSNHLSQHGSMLVTLTRSKGSPVGEYETSITLLLDAPVPHPISIPIKGLGYIE